MSRTPFLLLVVCSALSLASDPGGPSEAHPAPAVGAFESAGGVADGLSAADRAGIREAYEASRHAAFAVGGGYQARNPGLRWDARFDGRGFETEPDAGGWTWGLQLERYGFAGSERAVSGRAQVSATGSRVAYDWDATLQEWYVNDTRGLEHGYTVHQRPPQDGRSGDGPLSLVLAVRGDLCPEVQADGLGVDFVDGGGAAVVTYSGLLVTDADGQPLAARLEPHDEGLRLSVDERGARYPLTIDPIAQQAYLKASNTGAGDIFGYAISVSGNTVAIGAFGEGSNATGVNGNQADNTAPFSGAVYVFVRSGATWTQQAYLKASNTEASDLFGSALSLSGDTLVVGAQMESSGATGVNGDQADNFVVASGAAYVFVRSGTTWTQQAYLKASNTDFIDHFGYAVAASGDTVAVSALSEDSSGVGVNGEQLDDKTLSSGAVYVFVRNGTTWSQQAYLKASNPGVADEFGFSLSMSGETLLVGAVGESSAATGVNGNQLDNASVGSGAAYVFVRSGTTWTQQAYLKASNTASEDQFATVLALSGDTAVIGAPAEDSNAKVINGDQGNNSASAAGAAYVFVRSGTTWSQQAYLKATNSASLDTFGISLALSGNTIVIGAIGEDSEATGVNGNQANNQRPTSGAAYVFVRSGITWSQLAYLKASNTDSNDAFGFGVGIDGEIVVIGAQGESSAATGVNGNQTPNNAADSGAAYAFDLDLDAWTDLGLGLAGVSGVPKLVGVGTLAVASSNQLQLTNAKPSATTVMLAGLTQVNLPFKGGTLVPSPMVVGVLGTNAAGAATLPFTVPPSVPAGTSLFFQFWTVDAAGIAGWSASNGLKGLSI